MRDLIQALNVLLLYPPGHPIPDPSVSVTLPTIGGGGITTLGDTVLLETLAHFNRERIPER